MQVIRHGFSIKNEVIEITSIKPGGAGSINGNNYPASVKFRSVNVVEDAFEDTIKEIEEIIEYVVVCDTNDEATEVTNMLRELRHKKQPIIINTSIPKLYSGSQIYNAKSLDMGKKFMDLNQTIYNSEKKSK